MEPKAPEQAPAPTPISEADLKNCHINQPVIDPCDPVCEEDDEDEESE